MLSHGSDREGINSPFVRLISRSLTYNTGPKEIKRRRERRERERERETERERERERRRRREIEKEQKYSERV